MMGQIRMVRMETLAAFETALFARRMQLLSGLAEGGLLPSFQKSIKTGPANAQNL
jgi:hypothetical protein